MYKNHHNNKLHYICAYINTIGCKQVASGREATQKYVTRQRGRGNSARGCTVWDKTVGREQCALKPTHQHPLPNRTKAQKSLPTSTPCPTEQMGRGRPKACSTPPHHPPTPPNICYICHRTCSSLSQVGLLQIDVVVPLAICCYWMMNVKWIVISITLPPEDSLHLFKLV